MSLDLFAIPGLFPTTGFQIVIERVQMKIHHALEMWQQI